MNNNLFSYNAKCPLCNSSNSVNIESKYYNVYSELISKEFNIDEKIYCLMLIRKNVYLANVFIGKDQYQKKFQRPIYKNFTNTS